MAACKHDRPQVRSRALFHPSVQGAEGGGGVLRGGRRGEIACERHAFGGANLEGEPRPGERILSKVQFIWSRVSVAVY